MKKKNNLDEMQEQKLLRIEHFGCWFAFWGLFAVIMLEISVGGSDILGRIWGEWLVFMCLAIYLAIATLKNGIWDRRLKPSFKTNLIVSALAGVFVGVVDFIRYYINDREMKAEAVLLTTLPPAVCTFVLCIVTLSISLFFYKRKTDKEENKPEE